MKTTTVFSFSLAFLLLPVGALEVRDEDNAGDNQRFVGSLSAPATLSANPNFLLDSFDTTGVGYYVPDTRRQFGLISPRHFVCATHFRPAANQLVRFLGSDGVVYSYTIESVEIVRDGGTNTDLSLGTFSEAVDTAVITPFRYANLADNSAYEGAGRVFGIQARAGKTTFEGIVSINVPTLSASFNNTEYIEMSYLVASGDPDDSFLEGGDSGSPSFITENGELALVGTNSLTGENATGTILSGFAAFVPFYTSQLNAFMADEGFQISPLNPESTSLTLAQGLTATLGQASPGCITVGVTNTGTERANNVEFRFTGFSADADSFSGTDFVFRSDGGGTMILNRAFLDPGETGEVQVCWDALPNTANVSFSVEVDCDESSSQVLQISEPLISAYDKFTEGLSDSSLEGDDDGDGIGNLQEYALGGDVAVSSLNTPNAQIEIGLTTEPSATGLQLSFLRRDNAFERGLNYRILSGSQFPVTDLLDLSSATVQPVNEPGFERVVLELTDLEDRKFFTLGVELGSIPTEP